MLTLPTVPEPIAKRKTLVERAGEPVRTIAAPKSSTTTSAGPMYAFQSQNPSAFSQSYRSNSRSTSNSSAATAFSTSVGTGIRPTTIHPTSNLARPKSSLAKDRGTRVADLRPATSLGTRGRIQDGPNNKCMVSLSSQPKPIALARAPVRTGPVNVPKRNARNTSPLKGLAASTISFNRNVSTTSITERMLGLSLYSQTPTPTPKPNRPDSPSRLPRPSPQLSTPPAKDSFTPAPFPKELLTTPRKNQARPFLTKESNLVAWDPEEQYGNIERMYEDVCKHYKQAMEDNMEAKEINNTYKSTLANLEQDRRDATEAMIALRCELETTKFRLESAERASHDLKRDQEAEVETIKNQHRAELELIRQSHRDDVERLKADHREEIRELKQRLEGELENERAQRIQALSQVSTQGVLERQRHQMDLESKDHEIRTSQLEIERLKADLEREKLLNDDLRRNLSTAGDNAMSMESARQALQAKIEYLESDSKSQSEAYAAMERRMNEALEKATECEEKLRREEILRRKLHNQVQELKGNIRVFCRVRPTSGSEEAEETAKITFPESDEEVRDIEIKGPEETNSLGKVTTKTHQFTFDRVFEPSQSNAEIFEEISQLIQSALDGYNVCIFAYGQTGSGKTFTMSSEDGMIPRALRQIYNTSKELESRGWKYTMEGSFVEVYNEELRDLLGKDSDNNNNNNNNNNNKKHQILHDSITCETTITDVTTLNLDSQDQVEGILAQAMSRRSVAATKANERSSRSHSVFILKLAGYNTVTGKKCKGTLNLVDLAGSERLSHSKVEGARLKETQNINKSLSCLGDVIGALGQQQANGPFNSRESGNGVGSSSTTGAGGAHIPYRNSKLTYLLQYSLGGNSKTLMFVMVAPERKCLAETITSLKFADKVSKTKIGVARKTVGGK
ncbi:kinesin family member C1 [Cladophialophora psammophila CBS 110553]|uniref:Kinesin-like protein n=1 Tax=Cladophialophora psammophila CBS 110553 TaxID=1182543 RepID=W9WUR6_9EURO|nr:kinesin family member C1 [Cladophialophora psammophila CBS 110553]EXJ68356.1 kinesin family member C1 [Cladophialophora psammophila CBS 110553]